MPIRAEQAAEVAALARADAGDEKTHRIGRLPLLR
jgi:hypothetical protein